MIVGVSDESQFVGRFGEPRAAEIDALQWIGFDHVSLPGRGIEQRQRREIHGVALIGLNVGALTVLMKAPHAARFEHVA